MNRKFILQQDEYVLSTLTGLLEIFDGIQNIYFGDLVLTNKRLHVMSPKLLNIEMSFWFEGEIGDIEHSTLILGEHRIAVRWVFNGKLQNFIKSFQNLKVNA
ncbi:hypothetical protein [Heyndrickxia oleronia]|uniref:Uncharacterized protein n=1 Tax=Heyndrickxia oleronia TaxID=38875 RepID=A0AAW6SUI1_9BACI|nr:hypothetical protein [Heyndrickxia oleronia]MDH5160542.1 hypothetical protein [Heyndrickxia oleronia]